MGLYVDGYAKDKNLVLEYFGCAIHGHLDCFHENVVGHFSQKNNGTVKSGDT